MARTIFQVWRHAGCWLALWQCDGLEYQGPVRQLRGVAPEGSLPSMVFLCPERHSCLALEWRCSLDGIGSFLVKRSQFPSVSSEVVRYGHPLENIGRVVFFG